MLDVLTVADTFLKLANAEGKGLSARKVLNLCLIAYTVSEKEHGCTLFTNEVIEKDHTLYNWLMRLILGYLHNYDIPDLTDRIKVFGRRNIPFALIGSMGEIKCHGHRLEIIRDTYKSYGHYSEKRIERCVLHNFPSLYRAIKRYFDAKI